MKWKPPAKIDLSVSLSKGEREAPTKVRATHSGFVPIPIIMRFLAMERDSSSCDFIIDLWKVSRMVLSHHDSLPQGTKLPTLS